MSKARSKKELPVRLFIQVAVRLVKNEEGQYIGVVDSANLTVLAEKTIEKIAFGKNKFQHERR